MGWLSFYPRPWSSKFQLELDYPARFGRFPTKLSTHLDGNLNALWLVLGLNSYVQSDEPAVGFPVIHEITSRRLSVFV